jgi:protein SCO1
MTGSSAGSGRFAGADLDPPLEAPDFALHDPTGRTVRLQDVRGRVALVTFLYTHCPDVCPLIAQNLNQALRELGPTRSRVRVLAVSVDPKGDSPAAVRSFVRTHRLLPQFRYLIGTRDELERVWRAYGVAAVAQDPELVDHSAYTALVDPEGRELALYDARVQARDVVHDVRLLLRKEGG